LIGGIFGGTVLTLVFLPAKIKPVAKGEEVAAIFRRRSSSGRRSARHWI
jgi:hypothetical protein